MTLRSLTGPAAHLSFVALLVAACANSTSDDDSGGGAEVAAKEAFLTDYCAIISECCSKELSVPKDDLACKKRIPLLDPKMVGDAQARTACLEQLRKVTASNDFCSDFGNFDQPACPDARRKELLGAKKQGEPCATIGDCAPSFEGVVSCDSVCQVTKRGKEGDGPCVATVDGGAETRLKGETKGPELFICHLRDELVCDSTSKKCIKPVTSEGKCKDSDECIAGFYCNKDTDACAVRRSNGNACDDDEQCQGKCIDGYCESSPEEGGRCATSAGCDDGLACLAGKCTTTLPDNRLSGACVTR
jgi:hypothetical protein